METPYRTHRTAKLKREKGEVNTLPSQTQPDMSMTIQEILVRHTLGKPIPKSVNLMYTGEDPLPHMERLTQLDRIDYVRAGRERMRDLSQRAQSDIDAHREARKKAHQEAKQAEKRAISEAETREKNANRSDGHAL